MHLNRQGLFSRGPIDLGGSCTVKRTENRDIMLFRHLLYARVGYKKNQQRCYVQLTPPISTSLEIIPCANSEMCIVDNKPGTTQYVLTSQPDSALEAGNQKQDRTSRVAAARVTK